MYRIGQRVELIRPLIGHDIEPMTRGTITDIYGPSILVRWDTGDTTEITISHRDYLAPLDR